MNNSTRRPARGPFWRPLVVALGCRRYSVVILLLTLAAPVAAQAGWVATATHGLTLNDTVATSPVAADKPVHIVVSLKLRNADGLKTFLKNQQAPGSAQYGVTLTPEQFVTNYSPTETQVDAVVSYLENQGFTDVTVTADRLLVEANGTAGTAEQAFNTTLAQFSIGGQMAFAPVTGVMVPDTLGDVVLAVSGLEDVSGISRKAGMTANMKRIAPDDVRYRLTPAEPLSLTNGLPDPSISTFTPAALRAAYDANGTPSGAGTVVAIVTEGDDLSQVIADLRQAERDNQLPIVPVEVRQIEPVPSPPDTSGDGEWDLDSQSITGLAYNVNKLIFYNTASLNDADLLVANDAFAADNVAKIGNMSYGGCENVEALLGSLAAFDTLYEKAVSQGQTWSASSGDSGAACALVVNLATPDEGVPSSVEYPASSPWVTAVGGTTLFTDSDFHYYTELAWDAGGGGSSLFETAPDWQANDAAVPLGATGLRGVPDVAMAAGPEGAAGAGVGGAADVVVGGAHEGVLGTSWSSPLNVGAWARMESARCNALGFEAPQIYALDQIQEPGSTATGMHDVVVGSNGEYSAAPGWDYTTGYGSFDLAEANAELPAAAPGCTPADKLPAPTAQLAASPSVGVAPQTVTFDDSGSSDPTGRALTVYVLDYGDGSAPTVLDNPQSSTFPDFPPHSYGTPGTYTATLTVRNAAGTISQPATQTVTVLGTPAACLAGGDTVLTSPAGVSFGTPGTGTDAASGTDDLRSMSISEPADQPGKLVFTMKVANLSTVPPGFRWVTYFDVAGRSEPMTDYYYVAMTTSNGTPAYYYGTHGETPGGVGDYTVLGTLDPTSTYNADGTITLVLDKSALSLKTGDRLTNIVSTTRTSAPDDPTGTAPGGEGLTQDSAGAKLPYTVVGNATCAQDAAPVAQISASPSQGPEPLAVTLDGSGSTAASGASVAYYRFDFGDGTAPVWQTSATVAHTYSTSGTYTAKLEVADSRGLESASDASVAIEVQAPLPGKRRAGPHHGPGY